MVISLIILVMTLVVPALNGIKGAGDVTKCVYDISGALDQARAYAIANNTYVYVGIGEFDATYTSSANPQISGTGRLAIATVASKDGTRGYDISINPLPLGQSSSAWTNYNNGKNLTAVGNLVVLENVHMPAFITGSTGGLSRPTVALTGSSCYSLGSSASASVTPFDWPLGTQLTKGQYSFTKVINFDPQGIARIQFVNNADMINDYMEIDLQQTHGTVITSGSAVSVVQIDSMTGSTHIYRP